MNKFELHDTIAAIATSPGESGIGIVRISGTDALEIADRIFASFKGRKPSSFKTYTTHYGWVTTGASKQDIIDEVILTVMRAPKSYTREDTVEINCHGGVVALRRVMDLALEKGCRLAEAGEFTRRAFLNGRIDLAQAEAVLDIIRAKTDASLKIGVEQLKGALSSRINKIRKILLDTVSVLEANIDFPDDEIDAADLKHTRKQLDALSNELRRMLDASKHAKILREGLHVVICGKPNVGKSSLLNALLKQERSIVTSIPGTTRDTIEEIIDIKGIPVRIVDTAGIIEPRDFIEKQAVKRSRDQMVLADLVIILFDGNKKLSAQDLTLIKKLKQKACIAVINKIDLRQKIQRDRISRLFKYTVDISARKLRNINLLEDAVANLVYDGKIITREPAMVCNLRHIDALRKVEKLIAHALNSLDNKLSQEFVAQDLKDALTFLDDILGKRFQEDLLDKIFSEFCIGK